MGTASNLSTQHQPEVFAMLNHCLPEAAQAVTSAPAGAPLSGNMSYLFNLIKRRKGTYRKQLVKLPASSIRKGFPVPWVSSSLRIIPHT